MPGSVFPLTHPAVMIVGMASINELGRQSLLDITSLGLAEPD